MHELSLADEILRLVEAAAQRDHFTRVATLKLECGSLAGVEVSALRFALESISVGTCLEGAAIAMDEPAGRAWCSTCAKEVLVHSRADACPVCAGFALNILSGGALRLVDLVVVDD